MLRLQVGILASDVLDARAVLLRVQVVVTDDQCNMPHDCIKNVDTKAVMTVRIKFAILLIVSRFIVDIITFLDIITYEHK